MKSKWGKITQRSLAAGESLRSCALFLVPVVALILATAAQDIRAESEIPFSRSKMIIEFNSTADDIGVQVSLDGEPWRSVKMENPNGLTILDITASRSLRKQGLTELFFESSEPSLADVPIEEFFARFPEGVYEFEGTTVEGQAIEGEAVFTHVIPAGPVIVSPLEGAVVNPKALDIVWNRVTETRDGDPVKIVAYQVIVERTDNADLGAAPRLFDVKLKATSAQLQRVTVPRQFLEKGIEYKFEILAIEEGGNQTITEGGPFTTTN
jgi:hypothetical protein